MSDDYEVGYGKPPKRSQFQKGRSGNPAGRSKKLRKLYVTNPEDVRELFINAMEDEITVVENGRKRKMPAILAMYKQLTVKAIKGDYRTAKFLAETYEKAVKDGDNSRVALMSALLDLEAAREREYQESLLKKQSQT